MEAQDSFLYKLFSVELVTLQVFRQKLNNSSQKASMPIFPHTLNTHYLFHNMQHTPKMVNTRAKTKRIRNTLISNSSDSMADHQPIMSAALVASNDDLITNILHRLPVTSVLRFKSVSKHWNSLLSHRRFTLLYDRLLLTPGLFVCDIYIPFDEESRSTPPFRKLDFYLDLSGITIVQSCNGLLLCRSNRGHVRARKYYVFNPTTKQFVIVPSVPGGMNVRKTICFMGLAFHQTDCPHYKVVCIHRAKPDQDLFQIQIYSSETGKWKISDQTFSTSYFPYTTVGVYWNQAIYWAPSCINPSYFKLDVEQLQKLPLPVQVTSLVGYQFGAIPCYFGESRGHLHMVERRDDENRLHLNVYEMMSDNSGWFIKYQVELDELPVAYPEMINSYLPPSSPYYYEFKVFDVVRGEEEEETFMAVGIPGKVIRVNLMDKSFKQIFDLTNIYYDGIGHSQVHRYIQTLSSLYHK